MKNEELFIDLVKQEKHSTIDLVFDYEKVKHVVNDVLLLKNNNIKEDLMLLLIKSNQELLKEEQFDKVFNKFCHEFKKYIEELGRVSSVMQYFVDDNYLNDSLLEKMSKRISLDYVNHSESGITRDLADKIGQHFDCQVIIDAMEYFGSYTWKSNVYINQNSIYSGYSVDLLRAFEKALSPCPQSNKNLIKFLKSEEHIAVFDEMRKDLCDAEILKLNELENRLTKKQEKKSLSVKL